MGGLTRFVLLRTRGFLRVLARALLGTLGSGGGCAFFAGSFLGFALKLADGHGRRLVSGLLRSVLSRVPEPCLALHGARLSHPLAAPKGFGTCCYMALLCEARRACSPDERGGGREITHDYLARVGLSP
jgi:hypothetical protein